MSLPATRQVQGGASSALLLFSALNHEFLHNQQGSFGPLTTITGLPAVAQAPFPLCATVTDNG
jgi:hypothetical protein